LVVEVLPERLAGPEGGEQVEIEHGRQARLADLAEELAPAAAGAAFDQDVDRAESGGDGFEEAGSGVAVGEVQANDRPADPAGAPGDDRALQVWLARGHGRPCVLGECVVGARDQS
jgi:hypothetical protein